MAMHAMSDMLWQKGCLLKILAVNTDKYFVQPETIPLEYKQKTDIEFVYIDTNLKKIQALSCLLRNKSYHIERFISEAFKEKLISVLSDKEFDIVQIESLYLCPYIPVIRQYSKAKIVLRAHNVEHKIWKRIAQNTMASLKKFYIHILTKQLKKYELNAIQKVDAVATISDRDKDYFRSQGVRTPIETLTYGVNPQDISYHRLTSFPVHLFSIGSMNWLPNLEGLRWFLDKVWMKIYAKYPDLLFHIAGRNIPYDFPKKRYPNVNIVGEVPDAKEFMKENGILIVPLLSGSGIRIKIIEGMMLGKPIITTTVGKEGIDATHRENILIADTPDEFISCLEHCFTHPEHMHRIGKNAVDFISLHHNNEKIAACLLEFYECILTQ
jgi:glycosyltransferase involved in cell wall biosynthesis